ncbi:MAG: hypothetical protein ACKODK_13020 [Opitutaceae bacterium]
MSNTPKVLHVDSDGGEQRALEQLRRERGLAWVITPASSLAEARTRLAAEAFDVIVTELRLPDGDAFDLVPDRAALGDRAALLVTGHGGEAAAAPGRRPAPACSPSARSAAWSWSGRLRPAAPSAWSSAPGRYPGPTARSAASAASPTT